MNWIEKPLLHFQYTLKYISDSDPIDTWKLKNQEKVGKIHLTPLGLFSVSLSLYVIVQIVDSYRLQKNRKRIENSGHCRRPINAWIENKASSFYNNKIKRKWREKWRKKIIINVNRLCIYNMRATKPIKQQ